MGKAAGGPRRRSLGPAIGQAAWGAAIHLRSVCEFYINFRTLRCHPCACMLLNLGFHTGSIPTALTTPHGFCSLRFSPLLLDVGKCSR
jgi:hypothetical protein